jgi:hypothetical protein
MIEKYKKTNQYFLLLYELKKRMVNKDYYSVDQIWLQEYERVIRAGFEIDNLPNLLVLIHPDFYYKKGVYFGDFLNWKRASSFTNGITETSLCMWMKRTGVNCIFNNNRQIRGKCEADHIWPNYLGGPSVYGNRLILCRFHNSMKGSDITCFEWDKFPEWLEPYINTIYNLKL